MRKGDQEKERLEALEKEQLEKEQLKQQKEEQQQAFIKTVYSTKVDKTDLTLTAEKDQKTDAQSGAKAEENKLSDAARFDKDREPKEDTARAFMPTDSNLTLVNFTPEQEAYLEEQRRKVESAMTKQEPDEKRKRFFDQKRFEEGCKKHAVEEKCRLVLTWCKKMLDTWQKDFRQARPETYLATPEGKMELGTLQQCERHIKPLFKLLKRNKLNTEILDLLYLIVQYCLMREYVKAHDKYVELGIGNSPWPMGVTMIGIHERSGRSRIFTSQQAHVLNDDT